MSEDQVKRNPILALRSFAMSDSQQDAARIAELEDQLRVARGRYEEMHAAFKQQYRRAQRLEGLLKGSKINYHLGEE